jgi:hypothetical protein
MVNSVGNAGTTPNNMSGIGIYCNVIDPSKLPPDHPILKGNMPNCTVVGPGCGQQAYPGGYYINNYGTNNTTKKRVTVLTDNYIQQLDQCLQSEDKSLREYAASEVVKCLNEDKTRYNNTQLNTLVNKMLLDPYDSKVRGRGLMALETKLAKGNEETVQILKWIEQDPRALDRHLRQMEKVRLQMSAETTMVNAPVNNGGTTA